MNEEKLTQEQIAKWKEEYGKVFKVVINDKTYVYRALRRAELRGIQDKYPVVNPMVGMTPEQSENMENDIALTCVLYPENLTLDQIGAGTPGTLADCISNISGFRIDSEPEEL